MLKLLNAAAILAAGCWCGVAAAQTVEFRIVEREGQTTISSAADAELNMAVQARVVGGAAGTALGNFAFALVIQNEPDSFGTLTRCLTSNLDGTYASTIAINQTVGLGGLPRHYSYLATINSSFNGAINFSAGQFTNTTEQEIGLIIGSPAGPALLGTPGLDANSDGNPDTYSGTGSTAPLDPGIGDTYFGAGGNWIDVYRFRYTATNLTSRTLFFDLRPSLAQGFRSLLVSSGVWGPANVFTATSSVAPTTITISVSDTGACCDPSGPCTISSGAACAGPFFIGTACAPTPCVTFGTCCSFAGECTVTFQPGCTRIWTSGGSCSPNLCSLFGTCCASSGLCTFVSQADCNGGSWTVGGSCLPIPCPPAAACCSSSGVCTRLVQSACIGIWMQSFACSPNPCQQPGSCCTLDAMCTVTFQLGCANVWTTGATCSPNPCQLPVLCCNATTGVCSTANQVGDISYTLNYTKGQSGYARSDSGGTVESITTIFHPNTNRLIFDATFSGATSGGPLITSGFWLVLDAGPNPKSHPGELALFYFDAATLSSPKLTIYAYNGANVSTSWSDGDPVAAGNQPGDLIKGAFETGYINALVAENVTIGGQVRRHLRFDIDATDIISHIPLYPAASPWFGTGFDRSLGLWFHSVNFMAATYESNTSGNRGAITQLMTVNEGYLDAAARTTSGNDPCPSGSRASPGAACSPTNTCPQPRACCNTSTGVCALVGPRDDCPSNSTFASPAASTCSPSPCPPAAVQISGTCCTTLTGACAILPLSSCTLSSHTWHPGSACTPNPCTLIGRCCNFITGSCAMTSQLACGTSAHLWTTVGTCSPNTCARPGACCNTTTGACQRRTQASCSGAVTWSQSTCSTNPCPFPNGVCCNFITGGCQILPQTACGISAHTWTIGGVCAPSPCPLSGACCNAFTGACVRRTQERCAAPANTWISGGVCAPSSCILLLASRVACPADFNQSGSADITDLYDFLNAWLAGAPSANFNTSSGPDIQDIFDFISSWFIGC